MWVTETGIADTIINYLLITEIIHISTSSLQTKKVIFLNSTSYQFSLFFNIFFPQSISDSLLRCVFIDSLWKLIKHIFVWPVNCKKSFLTFLTQVWDMDQAWTRYRQAHKYSSGKSAEESETEKMFKLKPALILFYIKCTHSKVRENMDVRY